MSSNQINSMSSANAVSAPSGNGPAPAQGPYADLTAHDKADFSKFGGGNPDCSDQDSGKKKTWTIVGLLGGAAVLTGAVLARKPIGRALGLIEKEGVDSAKTAQEIAAKPVNKTHKALRQQMSNGKSWEEIKKSPQFKEADKAELFHDAAQSMEPIDTKTHANLLSDMAKDNATLGAHHQEGISKLWLNKNSLTPEQLKEIQSHSKTFDVNAKDASDKTIFHNLLEGGEFHRAVQFKNIEEFSPEVTSGGMNAKALLEKYKPKENDLKTLEATQTATEKTFGEASTKHGEAETAHTTAFGATYQKLSAEDKALYGKRGTTEGKIARVKDATHRNELLTQHNTLTEAKNSLDSAKEAKDAADEAVSKHNKNTILFLDEQDGFGKLLKEPATK